MRRTCPPIATVLINTYREPTELYVDGDTIPSQEGITQGDPLAMTMYSLGTIPLIRQLEGHCKQIWYADDAAAIGTVEGLRKWWDMLVTEGPKYGYFPNPSKTWLILKKQVLEEANATFSNTRIRTTTEGRPYLGAAMGTGSYVESHMKAKVEEWTTNINTLTSFAKTQPHASYAALTHGLMSKWNYACRVTPDIGSLLQPLDRAIQNRLIPALTGRPAPNASEVSLFALPARLGGLGISIPSARANEECISSQFICEPLVEGILTQSHTYNCETLDTQLKRKKEVKKANSEENVSKAEDLKQCIQEPLRRSMELSCEKGSSSWLTTLPLSEHGFTLHKTAFQDALALRYGWKPMNTPQSANVDNPSL